MRACFGLRHVPPHHSCRCYRSVSTLRRRRHGITNRGSGGREAQRYGPRVTPIAFSTYGRLGRERRNALEALAAEARWNSDDPRSGTKLRNGDKHKNRTCCTHRCPAPLPWRRVLHKVAETRWDVPRQRAHSGQAHLQTHRRASRHQTRSTACTKSPMRAKRAKGIRGGK